MADVPHELSAQIGDGGEDATGDDVALDPGEPQFDLGTRSRNPLRLAHGAADVDEDLRNISQG